MSGFRCFSPAGQTIELDRLSCFIGPNASGKTAAMVALARMFSEVQSQRRVVPADFHLVHGEQLGAKPTRSLWIECRLDLPELEVPGSLDGSAVPSVFNQMIVKAPGATPYCRMRLEATWTDDGIPNGDVQQQLRWVTTASDGPEVDEGKFNLVEGAVRGLVRLLYVPAARDPEQQIRSNGGTVFGRLLQSLDWGNSKDEVGKGLAALLGTLGALAGVVTFNEKVQAAWSSLYQGRVASDVSLQPLEQDPTQLLQLLAPVFKPGEDGRPVSSAGLSDGLRSLFSLALSTGLFEVQEALRAEPSKSGFHDEAKEKIPHLTVFAIEEPENHLSPHHLGRVVSALGKLAESTHAQVLLSSHSPSIMRRIEPDRVRYFLGHADSQASSVMPLPLPTKKDDEAFKYVREAVRGFPELYFSRLVVLGEGASEEIVLRRLLEAHGTPLDEHFISIVPLGGRHVNHFWRLLHGLQIPFVTLLDLDREKVGGGWGRIQYVRDQLVDLHVHGSDALHFNCGTQTVELESNDFDQLDRRSEQEDVARQGKWLKVLEDHYDVFFSAPLDLDFSMLMAFPQAYKAQARGSGPRLPEPASPEYDKAVRGRMAQVLGGDPGTDRGATYTDEERHLFPWFKCLFVDNSKPVAHMAAVVTIPREDLLEKAPPTLRRLVERVRVLVTPVAGRAQ